MKVMDQIITPYKYRLILVNSNQLSDLNWVFLPGGLGFGSEYLLQLINSSHLMGNSWRLDFPEDGSNRFPNETVNFDELWREGLIDAITTFGPKKVVLVTHSVSAMLALTIPKLDTLLKGFVILNSAPSAKWRQGVTQRAAGKNLPDISVQQKIYAANKNDISFRNFFLSILGYSIKPTFHKDSLVFFDTLPYHYERYEWSVNYFHHKPYEASWVPTIPTLIMGSSHDIVTPIFLFKEDVRFVNKDNINIIDVLDAGHFIWIEQQALVCTHLESFAKKITITNSQDNISGIYKVKLSS